MESVMEVSLASVFWRLAGVLALIFANGFFVAAEFSIVFGELLPKRIALERSETTALWVVTPTEIFMRVFWPFIRLLHGMAQAVLKALGLHGDGRTMVHSEEELKMLVTASQEAGVLEEQEEQMLHRVFGFADLTAGQVMLPRTELVAVAADTTRDVLIDQIARGGHTRLPVYRSTLDDIVGMLHVTDVLKTLKAGAEPVTAGALAREALTVPETTRADDRLAEMRRRGGREALVIDEYGGTVGLVTFESLMERIVGDLGSAFGGGAAPITLPPGGAAPIDGVPRVGGGNEAVGV